MGQKKPQRAEDNPEKASGTRNRAFRNALWAAAFTAVCLCAAYSLRLIGGSGAVSVYQKEYAAAGSSYSYTGAIADGVINGTGEVLFADGSSYFGGFADGRFSGFGIFTSSDGWRYEGVFDDGKMTGEGVYIGPGGETPSVDGETPSVDGESPFPNGGQVTSDG